MQKAGRYFAKYNWLILRELGLSILTGKTHHKIKLTRLRKILIQDIRVIRTLNQLSEVFMLKLNFQKNKEVSGKTLFFMIGSFCTDRAVCMNMLCCQSQCFQPRRFQNFFVSTKKKIQFFRKGCRFPGNMFQR